MQAREGQNSYQILWTKNAVDGRQFIYVGGMVKCRLGMVKLQVYLKFISDIYQATLTPIFFSHLNLGKIVYILISIIELSAVSVFMGGYAAIPKSWRPCGK